ncbi:MAG: hypothetical protein GXP43_00700 [bacterium]|nr:hypothetical protein [bacterium]
MRFFVSAEIFEKLPGLKVGVATAFEVNQAQLPKDILEKIHKEQKRLRKELKKYPSYKDLPVVKAWHEAFVKLGINPKKYPPAIENLIRITAKGINLSSINPIVDLENYIALKHLLPVGGQDLAGVRGDMALEVLKTPLPFGALGGEAPRIINAQIPVYRDGEKILCIALNSKDCEEAKFTNKSKDVVIFIESVENIKKLNEALSELEAILLPAARKVEKEVFKL